MLRSWIFAATVLIEAPSARAQATYWSGWQDQTPAWQWPGPDTSGGYWFDETRDALATMQMQYWNGSYWPDTIQWIGALIDTITTSTQRTFTNELEYYDGNIPGVHTTASQIHEDIEKYYSGISAYYDSEDTIQIFEAAYDDAQWVVLEWLEVLKLISEYDSYSASSLGQADISKYAHRAHIFYNIVQDQFDTSLCGGGVTWNPALATYKNAITNELFVSSSIAMYLYFPGDSNTDPYPDPAYAAQTNKTLPRLEPLSANDPIFLQNAKAGWAWFKTHNFTNSQGLIVDGFHISDGQTTCDQRNEMVYSYNQGVVLSGLRGLWEATGDALYLQDGYNLIDTVITATGWHIHGYADASKWQGLGRAGILEDYCDAAASCSQDNLIFKGAYFEHMSLFCRALPTKMPLVEGVSKLATMDLARSHSQKCASYSAWIQHNAHAALSTRDQSGVIGEWWGASYANRTQGPAPSYATPRPYNSVDIWNDPQLLSQAPWKCDGKHGCSSQNNSGGLGRRRLLKGRQYPDAVRTVETQAQGLSVVRAAADSVLGNGAKL